FNRGRLAFGVHVNYLLDTCTLIWLANGGRDLSHAARQSCDEPRATLYASAASAWEVALNHAHRKLTLQKPRLEWWRQARARPSLTELTLSAQIALRS